MGTYYALRQEEITTAAGFLMQAYTRDKDRFQQFSTVFNDDFEHNYQERLRTVHNVISPKILTAEIKRATAELHEKLINVRPVLAHLDRYAQMADGYLTLAPKNMGCKEVRVEVRRKNAEGVLKWLGVLRQNIANNQEALNNVGYKNEQTLFIERLIDEIRNLNLLQNEKMSERKLLVAANDNKFKALWEMMQMISRTGRALFNYTDEVKAKNYQIAALSRKIRISKKQR
ncbi:hypothetical protein DMA11_06235 [Marinilabiliaceae bacterium JC017]|nr:hypothetical protein DMA11_06235 [Marinilabiliaceae bacterium JC017]